MSFLQSLTMVIAINVVLFAMGREDQDFTPLVMGVLVAVAYLFTAPVQK